MVSVTSGAIKFLWEMEQENVKAVTVQVGRVLVAESKSGGESKVT
jgi:hypothetical protein